MDFLLLDYIDMKWMSEAAVEPVVLFRIRPKERMEERERASEKK